MQILVEGFLINLSQPHIQNPLRSTVLHAESACHLGSLYNVTYMRSAGGCFENALAIEYLSPVNDHRGMPILRVVIEHNEI